MVAKPEISIPRPKSPAIFQKIHYQICAMPKRNLFPVALISVFLSLPESTAAQLGGDRQSVTRIVECRSPTATDGDTIRCAGVRMRLRGIDAPEMPGSCRAGRQGVQGDPYAARDYLVSLTRTTVRCTPEGHDRYG
jgi:endonuclease YncB( thermonuclease family)